MRIWNLVTCWLGKLSVGSLVCWPFDTFACGCGVFSVRRLVGLVTSHLDDSLACWLVTWSLACWSVVWLAGMQTGRHANGQTCRQTCKLADMQTCRQTDIKRADVQTERVRTRSEARPMYGSVALQTALICAMPHASYTSSRPVGLNFRAIIRKLHEFVARQP